MAKILDMPKLSPTMEEGVLSTWHKKEGDRVAVDDLLAEVETDKATMEFRSFDEGTLLEILVPAGAQVKLGQPVAVVGTPGEDLSALPIQAGPPAPQAVTAPQQTAGPSQAAVEKPAQSEDKKAEPAPVAAPQVAPAPPAKKPSAVATLERTSYAGESARNGRGDGGGTQPGAGAPGPTQGGRVVASPYVRKVAREMGVDLQGAQGSGPGGRVIPGDLETFRRQGRSDALARTPTAVTALARLTEEPERLPLSPMRKAIARRLTESKTTVPHFYLSIDVDASGLVALREQINAELSHEARGSSQGESQPLKVSYNDLLIKACAIALVQVPACNASFTPEAILLHKRVDISVAVAVPDGLVTPVVRRADQKSVVAIAREVRELASRARARKLKPEEMQDGTFSISNLGMFGIDNFAAVINPPEGAILAVGQVREVPVVVEGAVAPGQRLAMTLSCDHRVVDGAVGAAFLAELRRLLERPLRVLTG